MKAVNIQWDIDCPEELPTDIDIPEDIIDEDDYEATLDAISDYITDCTGYCHKGFEIVKENKNANV